MNFQELTERLMAHRRLLLRGDVDGPKEDIIATAMLLLDLESSEPIRLDIDSGGGDADAARYLCDVIRSLRSPVIGVVVGCASSAAFTILQACDERIALPNARLMFHPVSSKVAVDQPDLRFRIAHAKRLHEQNLLELSARSKQSLKKLRQWSRMERRYHAQEALELGFIDRIEYPVPKVSR
ncbi:MAG: hypothetical protein AMXMBFR44_4060 [Candidatus Campbellbacteria bacterium]